MLLTGTFPRSLDEKLRVAIPKRLRDLLLGDHTAGVYLTPGTDGSLSLYNEQGLETLARRLSGASPAQQDVRAFSRLFYAQAELLELDAQGRIRIPPHLATLAGLTREVVLVGVLDHLELWDRQRWDEYVQTRSASYDQLAERALGSLPSGPPEDQGAEPASA